MTLDIARHNSYIKLYDSVTEKKHTSAFRSKMILTPLYSASFGFIYLFKYIKQLCKWLRFGFELQKDA